MKFYIRLLVVVVVLAAGAAAYTYFSYRGAPEVSRTSVHKAKVNEVRAMAQLCTLEFYEDFPMRGSVGSKHIFARVALTGSVSFDLDSLDITDSGDTLFVTLPPEIVTVKESTEPGAYQIIDTWNDALLGSSRFTTAEENAVKSKVGRQFMRRLYAQGHIRRARAEAVDRLTTHLTTLYRRPVVVSDPTPDGRLW